MRASKPIILYLPDLFIEELDIYLMKYPPNFKFQKVYFYYIVHYLTIMQIQYKNKEYFTLNKKFLKNVTIRNIDHYIKILRNGEFIISDESYTPGVKSLEYAINKKFIKGIHKIELKPDSKIGQNIIKKLYQNKAHYNRLEPYLKKMNNELMKMNLDYPGAFKWIEMNANEEQKLNYLTSVNQIEDKRFRYFKRNKTNMRLDTNLTNFKSDLRQFIVGDYVSIDLKNSQPFLLGILIDNILNNRDTLCYYFKKENLIKAFGFKRINEILLIHQKQEKANMVKFRNYYHSVLKGNLYDEFVNIFPDEIERNEVKDIMFKVLFSRNEFHIGYKTKIPYENDKKIFASVYQFVYEVVRALKIKDHKILPIYLQRIESYLFIDCIAKELVENGIVPFTIHDSVIVESEHQAKTIEIMNDVFLKQIGITPSFDIKKLEN